MGEEIASENGRISDFQRLVTLTLDWVILHTIMHHSSTSMYIPNVIKIEETFFERTYGRTFETHFIRWTQRSRPKNQQWCLLMDLVQRPEMTDSQTNCVQSAANMMTTEPIKSHIHSTVDRTLVQCLINTHLQSAQVCQVWTRDYSFTCYPHAYPQTKWAILP